MDVIGMAYYERGACLTIEYLQRIHLQQEKHSRWFSSVRNKLQMGNAI
jgi:hypothetical protein